MKNLFTAVNPCKPIIGEVGDKLTIMVCKDTLTPYSIARLYTADGDNNGAIPIASPTTAPNLFIPNSEVMNQEMFKELPDTMTATVVGVGEVNHGCAVRALLISIDGMDDYFNSIESYLPDHGTGMKETKYWRPAGVSPLVKKPSI
jgi:hypothetical protein